MHADSCCLWTLDRLAAEVWLKNGTVSMNIYRKMVEIILRSAAGLLSG